jgi:DNA-binding beta-propeller fold protein YncE
MVALIYFALAVCVGDFLCRRFYQFQSVAHRCAAAILVGLLVSSWFTYLAGLAFFWASRPLVWANLLFFIAAIGVLSWPKWRNRIVKGGSAKVHEARSDLYLPRPKGSAIADWLLVAGYVVLVSWMMFASFNTSGGNLQISNPEYSDFGPNTALMQSFAVGHNFPTEYPHFSGDRIRYHFLFYFQAGNLEFLGLDPAWSLNLLSIATLVAMLVVVMTLGEVLFNSRAVGRVGSLLFFFFGSLAYVPFLHKQASVRSAIQAITHQREYLQTIFPYRGEAWGTWSQVTYLNQRHFASAIGILLLVLVFLVIRYRAVAAKQANQSISTDMMKTRENGFANPAPISDSGYPGRLQDVREPRIEMPSVSVATEPRQETVVIAECFVANLPPFIFSGVLLGLLPMWNSAVFMAAAAILGLLFILCPLRPQMLALAAISGVIALPQMLYLSTGSGRANLPKLLHWGYTIDHPTVANVTKYLGFTFGFKWLLIALALLLATNLQRRFFLAFLSLIAIAFCFQFTIEVLANQKFIHIWVIIANLFVAFALWRLWHVSLAGTTLPGKFAAIAATLLTIPGGIIDFFPIHNAGWSEVAYKNDSLIDWLNKNTTPREIFLTDRFVNHPILMAGRRVFYGWPYYAWSAGYDASKRDKVYTELFENRDPWKVYHLLKENGIKYVAYDNAIRQAQFIKRPNQELYATYFPKLYDATNYNGMVIYKVPDTPPPKLSSLPEGVSNMFEGGRGTGKGEFDSPTAMAVDPSGNILVADTGNGRIEKFSPNGTFVTSMGQFEAPNGIAIDHAGNIYLAEIGSKHRVQKLGPDGTFIAQWAPGFYGPRRIAIGPDDSVYVVDSGHNRIVKFSPDGQVLASWGSEGSGDGQFKGFSSVAADSINNKVYVADSLNSRIQVFDSDGKFLTKWLVPEWGRPNGFEDLAIDPQRGRLYASSANMGAVLVFDLNGTRVGHLTPKPPDKLDGPSALALAKDKLFVLNTTSARVSVIDLQKK